MGYNIYYGGTSGVYTNKIDVGNVTNAPVTGLVGGATYYFAATAYNILGIESDLSGQVSYSVPLNLAPTLDPLSPVTLNEDDGLQTINLSGITSGATDEVQTLTVTVSSSNPGLIPTPTVSYTSPNTTGTLAFTPTVNSNGTATITVRVNDGQPVNNLVTQTFTVTVNAVNDPPTLNPISNITMNEDAGLQTVSLTGISSGMPNENQTLTVTAVSSDTTLVPNPTVTYTSPNATGTLKFTPVANANGTATVTVTVNDGQAFNNLLVRTFTVTVNSVNDAPTLNTIANLSIIESAGLQTVNLSGIGSGAVNENQAMIVTATSSNPGLIPAPTVSYNSPDSTGSLTFIPTAISNGTATITVTVNDGQPVNNLFSRTFTVTVSPVNNQPTLDVPGNLSITEDAGLQTVGLSGIGSGAANENQTLTVTAVSSDTALIPNPTISYSSPSVTGTLRFTPVANANGTATITVTVNDGQALSNLISRTFTVTIDPVNDTPTFNAINNLSINESAGMQTVNLSGINSGAANENQALVVTAVSSNPGLIPDPTVNYISPNAAGSLVFIPTATSNGTATITVTVDDGQAVNNLFSRTFTVTVNPINNPPTLDPLGNLTLTEDDGPQTINLSGISSGAANENQTLVVTASSSNQGLIATPNVSYTSPNGSGTLSFTPSPNGNGTAIITVTVNDGQASSNLINRTFTVTVNPVNDTPTFNAINNLSINENAGLQTVNLSGISSGAANENQTLTITATSDTPGLIPNPTVNYNSPGTAGALTFTPVADADGTATITVTINDGQATNNLFTRTFTVTVNPVNDVPTLNTIGNININEDAGLQTVNLSGISSGAANENQTLVVTAISSNTGLIPNPAVNYTSPNTSGTLAFTPVPDANGTAIVTVTVNDGGVSNNILSRTFTVTVNAVNDQPTLDVIGNLAINQDAGLQAVSLSGISSGAANENQALTITAVSSNPALIPPPIINYTSPDPTGTLRFAPVAGARGTANITVTVNDGQTTNNLISRIFVVTINGLPSITSIPNQIITTNTSAGPLAFVIGDPETPAGSLTLSAVSSFPELIPTNNISFGGASSNRTITFTPLPDQSGLADITITVSDGSGSVSTTFQTTVLAQTATPTNVTLAVNGVGTISPDMTGKGLTLGKVYTLTAVPGVGQEFAGWSGTFSSLSPKVTFYATSNLLLQANFVPSPYIPASGTYNGLFYEDADVRLPASGFFTAKISTKGAYSAKLTIGSGNYSFSGKLNLQNSITNFIVLKNGTYYILKLKAEANDQISGQLSDGVWTATLRGDRSVFTKTNLAPYAGKYTMALPGQTNDPALPTGHGYGTLSVSALGAVKFSGSLADGTKVSQSAFLSRTGLWPLYASLYSGQGAILSWIAFTNRANDDLNGALSWIKKSKVKKAQFYSGGFTNQCDAIGSIYLPPVGSNILNLTTGLIEFTGGNLPLDFTNSITLGTGSKLVSSGGAGLGLSFSLTSGTFKGSAKNPSNGKMLSYGGVVLEKMNSGYGYLLGTNQSSQIILSP